MYNSIVLLLASAAVALACIPSTDPCLANTESEPFTVPAGNPVVTDASELSCSFDAPCCWGDDTANSGELEGRRVTKPGLLPTCFAGYVPSSGPFYSIANRDYTPHPGASAELTSCAVQCSKPDSTQVTISAYKSATSKLEVCQRAAYTTGAPTACQTYTGLSGQPQTFTLPGGEDYQIVLVTSGFGIVTDFVNIEEIQVAADQCDTTTTSTTTTETPSTTTTTEVTTTTTEAGNQESPLCQAIKCDFQTDLCNWESPPATNGKDANFKRYPGEFVVGNYDTGVNALAHAPNVAKVMPDVADTPFAATTLNPKQKAVMTVRGLDAPNGLQLKFKAYDATMNHKLLVCLNGVTACLPVTDDGVQLTHRSWQDVSVDLPPGTESISIVGENNGDYFGAVGVIDFEVTDLSTGQTC